MALGVAGSLLPVAAPAGVRASTGDSYVVVAGGEARVGNALIERRFAFDEDGFRSIDLVEKARPGNRWVGMTDADPSGGPRVWSLEAASVSAIAGGLELVLRFSSVDLTVLRSARVLDGVAAVRMQTTLIPHVALVRTGYDLERLWTAQPPASVTARAVAFNGGSDWHDYDYRRDFNGAAFETNAEWLDASGPAGAMAMLMQRRNYLSSVMSWTTGGQATARVDFSKDLLYLGPIEPYVVPPPTGLPSPRARIVLPGSKLAFEPVIVALGADRDETAWHVHKMLVSDTHPYTNTVNFNTDKVHTDGVDMGPRDGVNFAEFQKLLPIAQSLGVETFVFDDGWQRYNGDWTADPARYDPAKDEGFDRVAELVDAAGMRMGLWMAAGAFHPDSKAFRAHPDWACVPTGAATGAANAADPEGDRIYDYFAPGIGLWNTNAAGPSGAFKDWLRGEITRLIATYGTAEFKFDFLVWLDCVNPNPATIYDYHDAFFEIIESVAQAHPGVGLGLDETNDFRAFPFESMLRGPMWFQNGNPPPDALLHNVWSLAPFVPGSAIGQSVNIHPTLNSAEIDERMAIALAYHPTFWTDIRDLDARPDIQSQVKGWTDFFKEHRDLSGFAYPLLDDPLGGGRWSGLQPWNADEGEGYAMLYRLGAPNVTQVVRLHAIPVGKMFLVTDMRSGETLGTYTSTELRDGFPVTISDPLGTRILRIDQV